MFIAILGITVPVFVLASLLQFVFCVQLGVLPTTGWGSWQNVVLPTVVLSFGTIATYGSLCKVQYAGCYESRLYSDSGSKRCQQIQCDPQTCYEKCISPMYDTSRRQISGIFTGSFVVEKIFGIPGLGFYYINSINDRDYTMIIGTTVFAAFLFVFVQLIVDIAYTVLDPRIRVD